MLCAITTPTRNDSYADVSSICVYSRNVAILAPWRIVVNEGTGKPQRKQELLKWYPDMRKSRIKNIRGGRDDSHIEEDGQIFVGACREKGIIIYQISWDIGVFW